MSADAHVDNRLLFGGAAIASGLLSFLLIVLATSPAPRAAAELLPYLEAHRPTYMLTATAALLWVCTGIPFIVGLGALLGGARPVLARAAELLAAGGVLLLGVATFATVGAFLALSAAAQLAPAPAESTYLAAVLSNLSFYLSDPGLMTLGFGQLLFASLAWRGGVFPRLLSAIGYAGGLAGLLTLAVYQTSVLALVQIGALGVWGIATGIMLLRARPARPLRT